MNEETPQPAIRAGDAERERSIAQLQEAVVAGRLTLDEFSDRVGLAQAARTESELAELARDLPAPPAAAPTQAPAQHSAMFSMLSRSGYWELPAASAWRSIFGTVNLDLRQATLSAADSELRIFNLFGTVTVIVPEGVAVTVEGGGLFATQRIKTPETPPLPGAPRLRIIATGPGGTLNVRSREAPRGLRKLIERD